MASSDVIVAIFPSREHLTKALDHLVQNDAIEIQRAAIVARAASGETIVLDDDISADEGGIAGGTLGAAMTALGLVQLGALALPGVGPIIALGAGAMVGGLVGRATGRFAANLIDFGFKNDQIEELAHQLEQGHPALVLEIANGKALLPKIRLALQPYDAELVEPLDKAQTGQLRGGKKPK
ncbi:MAG: DUF1269 domain-containing protein [Chloroflexi bacterium]|nr:MAG: DUF1269 domain-containing protein [Chloroflexota bacterium]